jgi:hypothetical protein
MVGGVETREMGEKGEEREKLGSGVFRVQGTGLVDGIEVGLRDLLQLIAHVLKPPVVRGVEVCPQYL